MHLDFDRLTQPHERIALRPGDDAWGPFAFDVSGALPSGVTVSSAAATAFLDGGDGTWSEAVELIEPDSVSVTGDAALQLKLQGTGASGALAAGEYLLQLTLTLSNGGTRTLLFGPVIVESFA
jgi:hypothetical protein